MIKLDINMYDKIKDDYFNEIIKEIKNNYVFSNNYYFKNVCISDFFEDSKGFSENKVKKIIFMDFVDINNNDSLLTNYLKTGLLIRYSDFKIDNVLKNLNKPITQTNRYTYRQNYINIYANDWISDYLIKYPDYFKNDNEFKKLINAINQEYDKLNQEFIKIIKYDYLSSSLRHKIITSSGITVCPYCNRQYISYFSNKGVKYTTADLDHFYPKSIFSLFALSLYNFIPACQICNQRFKKKKMKKILYPFKEGFDNNAKFGLNIHDVNSFYGKSDNFDLMLEVDDNSLIKEEIINNNEMFHLDSLYQHHKPYVQELLMKKNLIYTNSYFDMMSKTFKKLNLSKEQLDIFLYGYSFDDDINKDKILSKLTKDILDK